MRRGARMYARSGRWPNAVLMNGIPNACQGKVCVSRRDRVRKRKSVCFLER